MAKRKSHLWNIFSLSGLYNFVRGNQLLNFTIKHINFLSEERNKKEEEELIGMTEIVVPYTPK